MDIYCLRDKTQSLHIKGFDCHTPAFFSILCLYDPEGPDYPLVTNHIFYLLPTVHLFTLNTTFSMKLSKHWAPGRINHCLLLPESSAPILDPAWIPLPLISPVCVTFLLCRLWEAWEQRPWLFLSNIEPSTW